MKEVENLLHKEKQTAQGNEKVKDIIKSEEKFSKMLSDAVVELEVLKRKLTIEKLLTALIDVSMDIDKYRELYDNAKERVDNWLKLPA